MVLIEAVEVGGDRRDLDEIDRVPRPAEGDRPLVEEDVDVDGLSANSAATPIIRQDVWQL